MWRYFLNVKGNQQSVMNRGKPFHARGLRRTAPQQALVIQR